MALSAVVSVISLTWFSNRRTSARLRLAIVLIALLIGVGVSALFITDASFDGVRRLDFFANTWAAIKDFWLLGSGLGTFSLVYPMYEATEQIAYEYAARAHNDYLHIFLELGLAGLGCLIAMMLLLVMKFHRTELSQAAMLALGAVAIHSLVDFPLRSYGIAVPVAVLVAVILSERPTTVAGSHSDRQPLSAGGPPPANPQLSRMI